MNHPSPIYLEQCVALVVDALSGRLLDRDAGHSIVQQPPSPWDPPYVLHFPLSLELGKLAQHLYEELMRPDPADGWEESLTPQLRAQLNRDRAYWLEPIRIKGGVFPRIIAEAGKLKRTLQLRYASQAIWHRWHTKPDNVTAEAFCEHAAGGCAFGDPAEWRARIREDKWAAKNLATNVLRNFKSSLLFVILNRSPYELKIDVTDKVAKYVCPACAKAFVKPAYDRSSKLGIQLMCPFCEDRFETRPERVTMEKGKSFCHLEPLFLPAPVWPCSNVECGRYFPLPSVFGALAIPPEPKMACPACGSPHRQRPIELSFYWELPPSSEPPTGTDVIVPPGPKLSDVDTFLDKYAGLIAEAIGRRIPTWALNAFLIESLAARDPELKKKLSDTHEKIEFGRLHEALRCGSLTAALSYLEASGDLLQMGDLLAVPAPRPYSSDVRPPVRPTDMKEEYLKNWKPALVRINEEQNSLSPEARISGRPQSEDGDSNQ